MKSTSSTMIPCKASSIAHHTSQQATPIPTTNNNRYNPYKRNTNNSLTISTGSGQTLGNTNGNHMSRHGGSNAYTHNGPIAIRLTNV